MNGLILDVIVVVIAVLFIIFGVWRGMYKMIFGLISSIAALVLAIVLASSVTTFLIDKTSVDDYVYTALDQPIQGILPADMHASDVEMTFGTDGTLTVSYSTNTYASVSEYLTANAPTYAPLGSMIDSLVGSKTATAVINPTAGTDGATAVNTTLAGVLSTSIIVYIMLAAVFIILWILAYIVMRLLMALVKKLVHATYIGHFLDKVLGFVLGAAIAMVIIWGALAVIRLLGTYTWIIPANELIQSSTITKWLFENNYLYNFIVQSTNMQQTITEWIGKITNIGGSSSETTAAMLPLDIKLV